MFAACVCVRMFAVCVSAYVLPVAVRAFVHVLYVLIMFVCVRACVCFEK